MKLYIIQIINYTLSFLMWMIVGRSVLRMISGDRVTFLTGLFAKITDPVYRATKKIMPFAREGWIPFLSIILIIVLRLLLILLTGPAGVQE